MLLRSFILPYILGLLLYFFFGYGWRIVNNDVILLCSIFVLIGVKLILVFIKDDDRFFGENVVSGIQYRECNHDVITRLYMI